MIVAYIICGFNDIKLETTVYDYRNTKLPEDFDGYKIIQLSDLHHKNFGKNQKDLIKMIKDEEPDLILLTGDIVDEEHTDMTSVENLFAGICDVAPIYYVSGNHELYIKARKQYDILEELLVKYDILDIDDQTVEIKKGNSSIYLHGEKYRANRITQHLSYADESKFNILMYHCSNYFDLISNYGYDMIFAGHTHGGVVRLPFIGGLIGNGRELFPKYAGGVYRDGNCTMFSSRGLGDATFPRFNNPPEIVCVILYNK